MLPIGHAEFGTEVQVETPAGRNRAVVVPKPFYDPSKDIPKQ
jgi:glycine cleavage system aminomethyltransferase T